MAKRQLKALFFDLDDTVYSITDFVAAARVQAVQAMIRAGLRGDEAVIRQELDEIVAEFGSNDERHFDKLLRRLPPEAIPEGGGLIVVAAGMVAYHQCKNRGLAPYEDAAETLRRLKEKRLLLGIVSAGVPIKQAEKVVRLGLHHLVEARHIHITEASGVAKTNPKIYVRACRAAGARPEECAYIGDNPVVDVDVPHRIGMRTFLSRRSGKYATVHGEVKPDHIVHNFWDLLEIIEREYEIVPHD